MTKQQLTNLRNSLYETLPVGETTAWDMITWAKELFQKFDEYIDGITEEAVHPGPWKPGCVIEHPHPESGCVSEVKTWITDGNTTIYIDDWNADEIEDGEASLALLLNRYGYKLSIDRSSEHVAAYYKEQLDAIAAAQPKSTAEGEHDWQYFERVYGKNNLWTAMPAMTETDFRHQIELAYNAGKLSQPVAVAITNPAYLKSIQDMNERERGFYELLKYILQDEELALGYVGAFEIIAKGGPTSPAKEDAWFPVEDRPLFTQGPLGWEATEDGDKAFIAAVPFNDIRIPGTQQWWIRHCVIKDEVGLCVVTDDDLEPAGWDMKDITHWRPWVAPPFQSLDNK